MYDKCNEFYRFLFAFAAQLRVKLYFTVLCPLQRNVLFFIDNLSIYSTITHRRPSQYSQRGIFLKGNQSNQDLSS